eukprot:5855195-Prymnesium_polylepis.1
MSGVTPWWPARRFCTSSRQLRNDGGRVARAARDHAMDAAVSAGGEEEARRDCCTCPDRCC